MAKKHRRLLILTVKVAIAAALLAWVLSKVHWHDYVKATDGRSYAVVAAYPSWDAPEELVVSKGFLWWSSQDRRPVDRFERIPKSGRLRRLGFASSIAGIRKAALALAVAGFCASLLIMAVRWWFLLRVQDVRIRLWEAVRLTFLGQFFNYVVPGTVGGDLVKAYYVSKHTPRKAAVLISVFVDRVMGLTELTILAGIMVGVSLCGFAPVENIRESAISVAVIAAIVTVTLAFLLSAALRRRLHLQKLYRRLPIARHIEAAGDAAKLYRQRIGSLVKAVGITFGAHIMSVGAVAMIGASLSLPTPAYSYFLYVPLIYIIGAVPLTPGGVGLIEKLFLLFFAAVNPSRVLALALLARFIPMLWGLPGIVVALTGPKLPGAETIQAELGMDASADEPR